MFVRRRPRRAAVIARRQRVGGRRYPSSPFLSLPRPLFLPPSSFFWFFFLFCFLPPLVREAQHRDGRVRQHRTLSG